MVCLLKHKTYSINWRNPNKNYSHDPIKNFNYCPTCDRIIHKPEIIRAVPA